MDERVEAITLGRDPDSDELTFSVNGRPVSRADAEQAALLLQALISR